MTNFFPSEEICTTKRKIFGLCDAPTPPGGKAYLDEDNGEKWVAVVHNESQEAVSFVPIDHCIDLRKPDGKMDNRCDCCLFHHDTIAFVELKKRGGRDTRWIIEGVEQLRATIKHF